MRQNVQGVCRVSSVAGSTLRSRLLINVCVPLGIYCSSVLTAVSSSEDKMASPGCWVYPCREVETLNTLSLDEQWKPMVVLAEVDTMF